MLLGLYNIAAMMLIAEEFANGRTLFAVILIAGTIFSNIHAAE